MHKYSEFILQYLFKRFSGLTTWFGHDTGKIAEAIEFLAAEGTFTGPADSSDNENAVIV